VAVITAEGTNAVVAVKAATYASNIADAYREMGVYAPARVVDPPAFFPTRARRRYRSAGQDDSGVALRWSFMEITPNSFRWFGERSFDE
jgi:hypothetical protein